MVEQATRRFRLAIVGEIARWHSEGVISTEVRECLTARYPAPSQTGRAITIMMILGSVLVGLGALLFVGSNWEHMNRWVKLVLIIGAVVASNVSGWICKFEPGHRPKLGSGLLLLGSLLFGASIWLLSQMFNFDTSLSNGLLIWTLGVAAMALATRSSSLAVLLAVLASLWNLSMQSWSHYPYVGVMHTFALTMLGTGSICMFTRSKYALYALLAGGTVWVALFGGRFESSLLTYGALLFACYLWFCQRSSVASPFLYVGGLCGLGSLLISTFDRFTSIVKIGDAGLVNIAILLAATVSLCCVVALRKGHTRSMLWQCAAFAVAGNVILLFTNDLLKTGCCNILLLALIGLLLAAGSRLEKIGLINISLMFFVMEIIARYFDMCYSMLNRSIFFVLGGLILLVVGSIVERKRRRLLESFS